MNYKQIEVPLQRFGVAFEADLRRDFGLADGQISITPILDEFRGRVRFQCELLLAGGTLKHSVDVPKSWVDMLLIRLRERRPRWFPAWLLRWALRKHPIEYNSIEIEQRDLFPELQGFANRPRLARSVQVIVPDNCHLRREPDEFWRALSFVLARADLYSTGSPDFRLVADRCYRELRGAR